MVFCTRCGSKIEGGAFYCPNCGCRLESSEMPPYEDNFLWLWGILGFLSPLIGLILWLIWLKDKPRSSRAAALGALFGILVSLIITAVFLIFVMNDSDMHIDISNIPLKVLWQS